MATSVVDMQKASQQSRTALLSVSQAIQDAPYGIRGMSNNIDFLTQQFLVLRTTAGGTGAALNMMFKSLWSASGVLIAISAASATVNYLFGGIEKGVKGATDELTKLIELEFEVGITSGTEALREMEIALGLVSNTIDDKLIKSFADIVAVQQKQRMARGMYSDEWILPKTKPDLSEKQLQNIKTYNEFFKKTIEAVEDDFKIKNKSSELTIKQLETLRNSIDLAIKETKYSGIKKDLQLLSIKYQEKINQLTKKGSSETQKENKEAYEAFVNAEEFNNKDISLSTQQQIAQNALFIRKAKSLGLTEIETNLTQKNLELVKELTEEEIKANEKQYDGFKQKLDLQNADKVLSNKELISNYRLLLIEAQSLGLLKEEIDLRQKIAKLLNKEEIAADKVKDMFDTLGDAGKDAIRDMGRMVATDFYQAFERVFNGVNSLFEIMVANFIASLIQMEAAALAAELFGKVAGGGSILLTLAKAIFGFDKGGYINEPVVGMGRSGRMYSIAEKGSELVIPNNRLANNMNSSRGAGGGAMNVIVTGKLKGRDIYLSNKYQSSYETLVRYA